MTGLENITLSDRYFLKKLAGAGGMGQVYQTWDRHRGTYVAVKVIHDARFVEAFIREAVILKELAHPNIVRFYSVEQDEDKSIAYIVMDWIDGKDLQSMIKKRNRPMGVGEVLYYLDGVQRALHYAHARGVYHCDIKPGNILVRASDSLPILGDFGLAHVAHEKGGGGTLAFMAPELFSGGKVSIASDIYALGVTLYQLLSKQLPFSGETRDRIIQAHINERPPSILKINPSVPSGISHVIEKALAKDPMRRQNSVLELWEDFSRYSYGYQAEKPGQSSGLYGIRGERANKRFEGYDISIGRSAKNDLRLKHPSVSRHHATIFWKQDRYFIRDNGSTVGTYLNRKRLVPHKPAALRNGDEIMIGVRDIFEFRTKRIR